MNFFVYLFTGLGEPLIGYFMNAHHDTSLVFLIVAVAGAASTVMALFIWREGRE